MKVLTESYTVAPYLLGMLIPLLICIILWHVAVTSKEQERSTSIVYGIISAMCLATAINMSTQPTYTHKATVLIHNFNDVQDYGFEVVEKMGEREYLVVRKTDERPASLRHQ